ncbi:MAG: hypothetical protein KTR14_08940, partial [Vampirovibrio sp.]|nr:hypothetical protein [Vampirovibrio sp.]
FAMLISFTTLSDLTQPLPDQLANKPLPTPVMYLPQKNPYLNALIHNAAAYTLPQKALLFAAGNTYATIPESPWARAVKGILEKQVLDNPVATSADRVLEHHLAYVRAHQYIGCRYGDEDKLPKCALNIPHQNASHP